MVNNYTAHYSGGRWDKYVARTSLTISPNNLGCIRIRYASFKQLGDQIRELGNVLQAPGRRRDAIEVASETHVIVPDKVADVSNVVSHVGQGAVGGVEIGDPVLVPRVDTAYKLRREIHYETRQRGSGRVFQPILPPLPMTIELVFLTS